ncbi:MAG: hypothetical protein AAFV29_15190, partial [Myxococcota bacterium]
LLEESPAEVAERVELDSKRFLEKTEALFSQRGFSVSSSKRGALFVELPDGQGGTRRVKVTRRNGDLTRTGKAIFDRKIRPDGTLPTHNKSKRTLRRASKAYGGGPSPLMVAHAPNQGHTESYWFAGLGLLQVSVSSDGTATYRQIPGQETDADFRVENDDPVVRRFFEFFSPGATVNGQRGTEVTVTAAGTARYFRGETLSQIFFPDGGSIGRKILDQLPANVVNDLAAAGDAPHISAFNYIDPVAGLRTEVHVTDGDAQTITIFSGDGQGESYWLFKQIPTQTGTIIDYNENAPSELVPPTPGGLPVPDLGLVVDNPDGSKTVIPNRGESTEHAKTYIQQTDGTWTERVSNERMPDLATLSDADERAATRLLTKLGYTCSEILLGEVRVTEGDFGDGKRVLQATTTDGHTHTIDLRTGTMINSIERQDRANGEVVFNISVHGNVLGSPTIDLGNGAQLDLSGSYMGSILASDGRPNAVARASNVLASGDYQLTLLANGLAVFAAKSPFGHVEYAEVFDPSDPSVA